MAAGGSVFKAGVRPAYCAELQARPLGPRISGFGGAAWGRSELTVEGCIPWQCGRVESTQTLESVTLVQILAALPLQCVAVGEP